MMPGTRQASATGAYRFRVSDVVEVPLRGTKLRLKLVEGAPTMKDLRLGSTLALTSPAGEERRVSIVAYASSVGRAKQARLERSRELDVIVTEEGAQPGVRIPAEIGWYASGPA
jgi:hypothetical protein